jgi:putative transposase
MRKSRFTEQEIIGAVKQIEVGIPDKELSRKYGVSEKTLYTWRKKYGGLAPSELQRLKQLEAENQKLKSLVADLSLDKQILQDVLAKKL